MGLLVFHKNSGPQTGCSGKVEKPLPQWGAENHAKNRAFKKKGGGKKPKGLGGGGGPETEIIFGGKTKFVVSPDPLNPGQPKPLGRAQTGVAEGRAQVRKHGKGKKTLSSLVPRKAPGPAALKFSQDSD